MRFLTRCVRAYREAALEYTYNEYAESEHGWTKEDGERTASFFASSTGQMLKLRLSNYTMRSALHATRQMDNISYHNGIARGITLCVRAIEDHIPERPRSATEQASPETAFAALR